MWKRIKANRMNQVELQCRETRSEPVYTKHASRRIIHYPQACSPSRESHTLTQVDTREADDGVLGVPLPGMGKVVVVGDWGTCSSSPLRLRPGVADSRARTGGASRDGVAWPLVPIDCSRGGENCCPCAPGAAAAAM